MNADEIVAALFEDDRDIVLDDSDIDPDWLPEPGDEDDGAATSNRTPVSAEIQQHEDVCMESAGDAHEEQAVEPQQVRGR